MDMHEVKSHMPVGIYRGIMKILHRKIDVKYGSEYLPKAKREKYISAEKDKKRMKKAGIGGNVVERLSFCRKTELRNREIEQKLWEGEYSFANAAILLNPYGFTPLSAVALFHTEQKTSVTVTVIGKDGAPDYSYAPKICERYHQVPIFGLYAGFENKVVLELFDENGKFICSQANNIVTEDLPDEMKDAVRVKRHEQKSAIPFILVAGKSTLYPFAFDETGEIRYLLTYRPRGYGLFPLSNGNFIVIDRSVLIPTYQIPHSTQFYEMDYLGRVHREYHVPKGCHHDVYEMEPDGNLLLVSNSNQGHMEDVILELDRKTGEIVKSLDVRYIFDAYYRDRVNWVHINSLHYDPKEKSVTFSARNLHSVIKINWVTNEVKWILANPKFWEETTLYRKVLKPSGEIKWHYQSHSAMPLSENLDGKDETSHLMVFDNHWAKRRRIKEFDNNPSSFVNIYTINEEDLTVSLEKQYQGVKSKITSNGILRYNERRVFSMEGYLEPPIDGRGGMIYEYDYDSEKVLNQYSIRFFFYRAFAFEPEIKALSKMMEKVSKRPKGVLSTPVECRRIELVELLPQELMSRERIHIYRTETILYVGAKDHVIDQIHLKGRRISYVRDLREPVQVQDYFKEMTYAVAIPLHHLEPGIYQVEISIRGECYDTKRFVEVIYN